MTDINPFETYCPLILSVFSADHRTVSESIYQSWRDDPDDEPSRYHLLDVELDFRYAYLNAPGVAIKPTPWKPSQILFWQPVNACGRTAMMTNALSGNSHAVFCQSKRVSWECVWTSIPDANHKGCTAQISYYRDYRQVSRTIGVGQEENGRWIFCEDGPLQPFEDPANYSRRLIRSRLNREILTEYMVRLGYPINHPDFWKTDQPAVLMWDDWYGERSRPGRDGIDPDGTFTGWHPGVQRRPPKLY